MIEIEISHLDEKLLKRKLIDRKLTLVAKNSGVSQSTLYNWMHGSQPISNKTATKLVNYLLGE